ncbi:MAG: YgeY family selenium metabolism-linked hydrolase [Chloroflexi bacterium]|nr:YgeY family selenium metabolism-linked hydrolase [Chloroflexota bacterium]
MSANTVSHHLLEAAARVRRRAEDVRQAQIDFLADLIRLKTYTGEEGPAVERILAEMRALGFAQVRADSAGDALAAVGDGPLHLLYDAHLDENEIADEADWPHPPLEPTLADGKLYGLGASDCKAGVASIVYGAYLAAELGITGDCTITVQGSTLEEDAEGFAMRHLMEQDGLPRPDAVLLAEATDLTLRRGHRGRCEVKVRVRGKAAHASTPELGENAILKARPVLDALEAMTARLPRDPVLGPGTQVVTMIESPHTPNSVPAWCEITIDRRLTPGETAESVVSEIAAAVAGLDAEVFLPIQPVTSWTGLDLSGPAFFPGWLLEEDAPLLEAGKLTCAALWGRVPRVDVWKFSTNGTYSAGAAGIPTLGFGPMEEQYVHTPHDQVDLEKLLKGAMFYALFPLAYSYVQSIGWESEASK